MVRFCGTVTSVTRDGRSGIIALDEPICDMMFAVISPDTIGRIPLINNTGRLPLGERVTGDAEIGSEALRATHVQRLIG
jgi:hypothetical protein